MTDPINTVEDLVKRLQPMMEAQWDVLVRIRVGNRYYTIKEAESMEPADCDAGMALVFEPGEECGEAGEEET